MRFAASIDRTVGRARHARGERGQGLVEFAVVIPVLLLVVCSIAEFGNLLRVQIQIQNAIREGARFTAIGGPANYHGTGVTGGGSTGCPSTADIQTVVRSTAANLSISVTDPTYNPSPCGACTQLTTLPEITVKGTYTYKPITPLGTLFALFKGSFANSIPLSSQATVYYEAC
jgi:Flp pilus assembly protein TadG